MLEYLGRLDFQVKVRGFRIEPGEIEAALAALPDVEEVTVAAHTVDAGDVRLVAYVAPRERSGAAADGFDDETVRAWRAHVAATLPEYMVPALFVRLDALPRTQNGKVDRKALVAPSWERASRAYVAPRTDTERILAGVFADALKIERVGATDVFGDLGGHSLLAMRVTGRVRRDHGMVLPLAALLRGDTLEQLAAQLDAKRAASADADVEPEEEFALAPVRRDAFRRGSNRAGGAL
jgi:hypothetical protein